MSFITEFSIESPFLRKTLKEVPNMRISAEDLVLDEKRPHKFVFTAQGTQFDKFETALAADPTVAKYNVLTKFEEKAYYTVTYSEMEDMRGTYPFAVQQDIVYTSIDLQDGEHSIRARVPNRDALTALSEYCRENEIPFRIKRIYQEEPVKEGKTTLTNAQRQAMSLAYKRGYFDSPREVTLEEIADELGISRQAVAKRLRRGHKNLIESTIM